MQAQAENRSMPKQVSVNKRARKATRFRYRISIPRGTPRSIDTRKQGIADQSRDMQR